MQCPQVLGAKRRHTAGFGSNAAGAHQGFVFGCDVVQGTPPALRQKAARLVGGKCTLLARVDAYGEDPSGVQGAAMKVGDPSLLPCRATCVLGSVLTWLASMAARTRVAELSWSTKPPMSMWPCWAKILLPA